MKLKASEIKPNPDNPRVIKDNAFKKLVKSLKEFPEMAEVREVVVNKDHIILGGNMRFRAMQEAGWKEVPVKIVDWPEYKQREFIVKDNVSGGEWDWDMLANEWDTDLLEDWGLDVPVSFGDQEVEEDEAPEVSQDPPISKLGEVYELGRHRVMCGDSTDKASVELLMDGVKADMVFTDPPYGMLLDTDYSGMHKSSEFGKGGKTYDKVIGDNDDFVPELITSVFDNFDYCDEIFLWGADYYRDVIPMGGSWIVWDKRGGDTGMNLDKLLGSSFELCWSKQSHKRDIARILWSGHHGMQVDDTKSRVHPTQKPAVLADWFFQRWAKGKKNIVDVYLGSGSTLIACEQTDRTCYGMELDPKYVDVIRKRYAKFIGEEDWQAVTPVVE